MNVVVFFAFIPSLIVADILCPNSKSTCPEGKQCCEVDGEYSCCDPQHDLNAPDTERKAFPGYEIMGSKVLESRSFSLNESKAADCNRENCKGTCCGHGCCPFDSTCCNGGCCGSSQICCNFGCCGSDQVCCGSWCCRKGLICGAKRMTCETEEKLTLMGFISYYLAAMMFILSGRLH